MTFKSLLYTHPQDAKTTLMQFIKTSVLKIPEMVFS